MEHSVKYRQMQPGEENIVIDLVSRVFHQFVAPLYGDQGVREFLKYAEASALAHRLKGDHFMRVAELDNEIVGVIEIRENSHIALFFVATEHQHRGIGRRLVRKATQECIASDPDLREITVNTSPNAVSAYRALGFIAKDKEKTLNGIRFVQMSLDVRQPAAHFARLGVTPHDANQK